MSDDNPLGEAVRRTFGGEELHRAMRRFDAGARAHGVSSLEVAVRWAAHHSALGDGDAIILGASREAQLVECVSLVRRGPLASPLLALVGELWAAVEQTRGDVL